MTTSEGKPDILIDDLLAIGVKCDLSKAARDRLILPDRSLLPRVGNVDCSGRHTESCRRGRKTSRRQGTGSYFSYRIFVRFSNYRYFRPATSAIICGTAQRHPYRNAAARRPQAFRQRRARSRLRRETKQPGWLTEGCIPMSSWVVVDSWQITAQDSASALRTDVSYVLLSG